MTTTTTPKSRSSGEYVDHHVEEEQEQMFSKVKKAGLDTKGIGERLRRRKEELMAEQTAGADAA